MTDNDQLDVLIAVRMLIRSYLDSPEAQTALNGKPFACAPISRATTASTCGR